MNSKRIHKKSIKRFVRRAIFHFLNFPMFSDKFAIKCKFRMFMGRKIDLRNPKTFNEKLNWMKLYYRYPIMNTMVDKADVKKYVSKSVGSDYVIPCIAVFDKWSDIEFDKIEYPCVIKTTHSIGVVQVLKNKDSIDLKALKRKINKSLRRNYYYHCREWPYKDLKPRIIIEKYIKDSIEENLPVFKFFCFDGKPHLVQTIKNDKTPFETIDYFDMEWNRLELKQNFNNSEKPLGKPSNFAKMKELASKLSEGFPFVRIDLYSVDGKIYFSEFTFFSDAGYQRFYPDEWDLRLGELINLKKYGFNN